MGRISRPRFYILYRGHDSWFFQIGRFWEQDLFYFTIDTFWGQPKILYFQPIMNVVSISTSTNQSLQFDAPHDYILRKKLHLPSTCMQSSSLKSTQSRDMLHTKKRQKNIKPILIKSIGMIIIFFFLNLQAHLDR